MGIMGNRKVGLGWFNLDFVFFLLRIYESYSQYYEAFS